MDPWTGLWTPSRLIDWNCSSVHTHEWTERLASSRRGCASRYLHWCFRLFASWCLAQNMCWCVCALCNSSFILVPVSVSSGGKMCTTVIRLNVTKPYIKRNIPNPNGLQFLWCILYICLVMICRLSFIIGLYFFSAVE